MAAVTATGNVTGTATALIVASETGNVTGGNFNGLWPTTVNGTTKQIEDQNGDPWFGVGDAAWSLVAQLSPANIETYLDAMAAAGVNFVMFSAPEPFYTDNTPAYRNQQGDLPFTGSVFASSLNENYWVVVDEAILYAGSLGITCFVCPQYSGFAPGQDGWQDAIASQVTADETTFTTYGNDLATRYAGYPNVVWLIGHDDGTVAASMITPSDRNIDALQAGTSHLFAFGSGNNSSGDTEWSGSANTSDFNTTYTYSQDAGDETATDWASKTTIYIEGYYEQEQGTELERRDQLWAPWMEGASATIFGNNPRWHFESGKELYSFTGTWQDSLTDVGTVQLGYLADFVAAVPAWGTTVPDTGNTFLTAGTGRARFDTATGIVYSTAATSITIDTTEMAGTDNVKIRRYDPTDGSFTVVAASEAQSSGRVITYPGANSRSSTDYVYLVELVGGNINGTPTAIVVASETGAVSATGEITGTATALVVASETGQVAGTAQVTGTATALVVASETGEVTATANVTGTATAITVASETGNVSTTVDVTGTPTAIVVASETGTVAGTAQVTGTATAITVASETGTVTATAFVTGTPTAIVVASETGTVTATGEITA